MAHPALTDLARFLGRADPSRPLSPALRLVQLALSAVFFFSLDLADFALCYVFLALDSLAGDNWGQCYCRERTPRLAAGPSLSSHSGGRSSAGAPGERESTRKDGHGCGEGEEKAITDESDSSTQGGGSLSISSPYNSIREDTPECPLLSPTAADQLAFQESHIAHSRKATLQLGSIVLTLPFSRPLTSIEPPLKRARTEPHPVCTLNARVPGWRSSPAILDVPPEEPLPPKGAGTAKPSPHEPQGVFMKLEGCNLEGDSPLAGELPPASPGRASRSGAAWRTGLRWSDCRCPECEAPEKEPGQRLHVSVVAHGATCIMSDSSSPPRTDGEASTSEPHREQGWNGASPLHMHQEEQFTTSAQAQDGPVEPLAPADVIFLHGFCSSSSFWGDTVLPHFSPGFLQGRRLLLVDLLGFGKSPKPRDCQYTVGEHAQRIEKDVLRVLNVRRFHIVAHSMGCTVALALAARNPSCVASITLFSPPFVVLGPGSSSPGTEFFRFSAPRLLGPGMDIGISIMAWYEHVGRLLCCILNKGHHLWEPLAGASLAGWRQGFKVPPSFVRDFMRHTHHSAWHCYYNTICEGANLYPLLLDQLGAQGLAVRIVHGTEDTLCPIQASRQLALQHPCVCVSAVSGEDHVTVVLGREAEAAALIQEQIAEAEQDAPC